MKKLFAEFKAFIMRGNVLDMAVGVIIATAFGKITTTLVTNVITPLIAYIFNSPNTDALNVTLRAAELDEAGEVVKDAIVLGFGTFVGAIIDFIIIALIIFAIVKAFNKAHEAAEARKKKEAEPEPEEEEEPKPTSEELLQQILEELQKQKK
ncbi:MAG: large conductance mechanosensitive channel protein MscL [Ruminococcaceae bacterium]|jgi:large conductance mechanosensitive channel|nr:large conductance mechanosensitive channel protein MscL [Oscillospiraceae bacterium]